MPPQATYTHITLLDVEPAEVATWLAENGHTAAVSPQVDDLTVIYENTLVENADEDEPLEVLLTLASEVSYELGCPAWLIIVDSDEALIYTLYMDGEPTDSYGVRAGYPPEGGDAEALADLFGAPKRQIRAIRNLLARHLENAEETASVRLGKLLTMLELPNLLVGYNYERVTAGETPHVFTPDDLTLVTPDEDEA